MYEPVYDDSVMRSVLYINYATSAVCVLYVSVIEQYQVTCYRCK